MARHKNGNWMFPDKVQNYEQAAVAVLMDIRDELQENNRLQREILSLLRCHRIQRMCSTIERLDKRIAKKLPLKVK